MLEPPGIRGVSRIEEFALSLSRHPDFHSLPLHHYKTHHMDESFDMRQRFSPLLFQEGHGVGNDLGLMTLPTDC